MLKLQDRFPVELRLHRFILCTRRWGVLQMRVGSVISQLDLQSLTPLYLAGCGRLQLGILYLATSVDYCKQLIIDPTFSGIVDSSLRGFWP